MTNPEASLGGMPNEVLNNIYSHTVPPEGRYAYNIEEWRTLASTIGTGRSHCACVAQLWWRHDLRFVATITAAPAGGDLLDFSRLAGFLHHLGPENVSTIRGMLIGLPEIPRLGESLTDSLWMLVKQVHRAPELGERIHFHGGSEMGRWRLDTWSRTVRVAIERARMVAEERWTEGRLKEWFDQWRTQESMRLERVEQNM